MIEQLSSPFWLILESNYLVMRRQAFPRSICVIEGKVIRETKTKVICQLCDGNELIIKKDKSGYYHPPIDHDYFDKKELAILRAETIRIEQLTREQNSAYKIIKTHLINLEMIDIESIEPEINAIVEKYIKEKGLDNGIIIYDDWDKIGQGKGNHANP